MPQPDDSPEATAERRREQEPPIGAPEELHPEPGKHVKEAAEESAAKGLPYEMPRPKATERS